MNPSTPLVVSTTVADAAAADALASRLVDARVAACVQVLPGLRSTYRWQGAVHRDDEVLLMVKTCVARYDELESLLHEHHPYDVPEIIAVPAARVSREYRAWLVEATGVEAADSTVA